MKSPEEKLRDKQRKNLRIIHNGIFSAFSFGRIKTWTDLYKMLGQSKEDITELTYQSIKKWSDDRFKNLESEFTKLGHKQEESCNKESKQVTESIHAEKSTSIFDSSGRIQQVQTKNESQVVEVLEDYGFIPSPNEDFHPWWHQKKAIAELVDKVLVKQLPSVLVLAKTGTGKTYMFAGLARRIEDLKAYENKAYGHMNIVYVGKRTILTQVGRVLKDNFNLRPNIDVECVNIERFRAAAGQYWVKQEIVVKGGDEVVKYKWKKGLHPPYMFVDESQGTRRPSAKQSQIMYAYNDLPPNVRCMISMSATPFFRVCEAKAWAVGTNRDISHLGFPKGTRLTNENWPSYASIIASPSKPDEYNEEAVKRLMVDLEDYVVRVKGVHPQFEADNGVETCQFESNEKFEYYQTAIERFLLEKAKLDAAREENDVKQVCYLVILLKYAMAAEFCHAEGIADRLHNAVKNGKAGVAGLKFKQTVIEVCNILMTKYGWKRSDITLIWGGGQTAQTQKQKAKQKIKDLASKLKEMGVDAEDLIRDADLEDVEDRVIVDYPKWLKLGLQSPEERQIEIDAFQSGKTKFALYTLKAGGVGLSLHHTDELTTSWDETVPGYTEWKASIDKWNANEIKHNRKPVQPGKVRKKKSGFAFEEDIPFIPTKPRETYLCVSYNPVELVQGVGRAPRLTSLSITKQRILCYAGTVEVKMGIVYSAKLRCLGAIVRYKEDWMPIVFGGYKADEELDKILQQNKGAEQDESSSMIDIGEDVESEIEENGDYEMAKSSRKNSRV